MGSPQAPGSGQPGWGQAEPCASPQQEPSYCPSSGVPVQESLTLLPSHLLFSALPDPQDRPWNLLTFFPPQSTVPEGANATFTCSFSNTSEHFVLNLYRLSPSNQRHKLAAFPEDRSQPPQDGRFSITRLPNGNGYLMSVVGVRLNDSGIYLCGAISLHPRTQIKESSQAELRVTGAGQPCRGQWEGRG